MQSRLNDGGLHLLAQGDVLSCSGRLRPSLRSDKQTQEAEEASVDLHCPDLTQNKEQTARGPVWTEQVSNVLD